MKEVKSYFDGTREKKLKEKKKEKERMNKLRKGIKKVSIIQKINQNDNTKKKLNLVILLKIKRQKINYLWEI